MKAVSLGPLHGYGILLRIAQISGQALLIEQGALYRALFAPRTATISLGVLGGLGAMLSVTSIFGMAAYSVSRWLRELGIRLALGGQRRQVPEAALGCAFKL